MADLRKCIGSARFGIAAHEAPVEAFPVQPSQEDGLGRMCKPHWNAYTTALRKAAAVAKAADAPKEPEPVEPKARRPKGPAPEPTVESGEAGAA